jgi:hypothetical protein
MKPGAGARPKAAGKTEVQAPEAMDRWIDALLEGGSTSNPDSHEDRPASADSAPDAVAQTARALADLPALDPQRQAAMRAALEARFALTAGAGRTSGDPPRADAAPRSSGFESLARRLGISASGLRLLALLLTALLLAGLYLERSRPAPGPAEGGRQAPVSSLLPGSSEGAGTLGDSASSSDPGFASASDSGSASASAADSGSASASDSAPASYAKNESGNSGEAAGRQPEEVPALDPSLPRPGPSSPFLAPGATPQPSTERGAEPGERYRLTGFVRDTDGRGIADAIVTAWRIGDAGFFVQRSEADGSYRLELAAGQYLLHAETDGHLERWYDGQAGSLDREDARKLLVPAADLSSVDFVLPH